jgi:hypothetical protein
MTDPTTEEAARHDADLQAIEPSKMPQARRLPPSWQRGAGIRTEPIVESASDMDDASDTDGDHDSENQWEYKRIVERWGHPDGPKWVKLKWANSVVREKGLAKKVAKYRYDRRKTKRWVAHGCKWVEVVWRDSWVPEKDVKGLDVALAEYEQTLNSRKRRQQ